MLAIKPLSAVQFLGPVKPRNQSIASTPWSEYELSIAEVQLEGW